MLPFDVARCFGTDCTVKDDCKRYVFRADVGPRTPTYTKLSDTACVMRLSVHPSGQGGEGSGEGHEKNFRPKPTLNESQSS